MALGAHLGRTGKVSDKMFMRAAEEVGERGSNDMGQSTAAAACGGWGVGGEDDDEVEVEKGDEWTQSCRTSRAMTSTG